MDTICYLCFPNHLDLKILVPCLFWSEANNTGGLRQAIYEGGNEPPPLQECIQGASGIQ